MVTPTQDRSGFSPGSATTRTAASSPTSLLAETSSAGLLNDAHIITHKNSSVRAAGSGASGQDGDGSWRRGRTPKPPVAPPRNAEQSPAGQAAEAAARANDERLRVRFLWHRHLFPLTVLL